MTMIDDTPHPWRPAALRIGGAVLCALAFLFGFYLLANAARPMQGGLIGFSFLLILPAFVTAFVCYVADPWKERSRRFYLLVPVALLGGAIILSGIVFGEGILCMIILSPLWLVIGLVTSVCVHALRRRPKQPPATLNAVGFLVVPLLAMQLEPMLPLPSATPVVTRSILVHASPARLWPLLEGVPDVRPGEGRWNLTQDVIGVPRPLGARLVGQGLGADRYATWQHHIRFRERIVDWQPGRAIGWRFIFDDVRGWGYTDEHLLPNSRNFTVTTGDYRVEPLAPGLTRLTIDTRYVVRTPVNLYSQAWGELFLGDLEDNLLALVKHRAESGRP
jgi:hypothetical protein